MIPTHFVMAMKIWERLVFAACGWWSSPSLSLSRCPGRQFNLLMNHKSLHHSLCQGKRDDRVIKKWEETQSRARVFFHHQSIQAKNCWCRFAVRQFALVIAARVCVWLSIADAVCVPLSAALTAILTCTRIGHWKIVQAYLLRRSAQVLFIHELLYCYSRRRSLTLKPHLLSSGKSLSCWKFSKKMNFRENMSVADILHFLPPNSFPFAT